MTAPIDTVGPPATLPAGYDPTQAKVNTSGTGKPTEMFDPQMFLNLLVAQLKYQDPTNPTDTSQFMSQTAMLSQVQTMNSMSSTLSDLVAAQQASSATAMIGKAISFVDPAGKQTSGIVDAVSLHGGQAMLHVGELAVPLAGVLAVANAVGDAADPASGGTPGGGTPGGTAGSSPADGSTGADSPNGTTTTGQAPGDNTAPATTDPAPTTVNA
jgi:flagellar basal-body rod modification protein FlgD